LLIIYCRYFIDKMPAAVDAVCCSPIFTLLTLFRHADIIADAMPYDDAKMPYAYFMPAAFI